MKAFFAFLSRAFPRAFRARFGPEMIEHAVEEASRAFERGLWSGLGSLLFGGLDLVVSGIMERWRPTWRPSGGMERGNEGSMAMSVSHWTRDFGHACRTLAKAPGFTLAAVGTLALALGANAGIFSVVDAVLLRPLPYPEADRLVYIAGSAPGSDLPDEFALSAEFFLHYRDHATQLQHLATFNSFTHTVRAGDRVERLRQSMPSLSLFETLGVTPILGRLPREGDGERVVLVSHALWTTWFGSDPAIIGRAYEFVGETREVIGVMGPDFRFPNDGVVAWIPFEFGEGEVVPGRFGAYALVGRLAPGADAASLAGELERLASQLPELYGGPPSYARIIERHVPVVRSLRDMVIGDVSLALWLLMGAVAVVLLIACANLTSLFSVRAEGRGRDLAVRRALGAGRGALIRSQLSEALVVAALAGPAAVLLASLLLPAFLRVVPDGVPRIADVHVSGPTLLFTLALAAFAALGSGLVASVGSSGADLHRLRDGARGATRGRHRGRDALVAGQTALALTLLAGSGLLLRSFQQLRSVDPGYDTRDILTFQFAPDQAHLVDGPSWASFHLDFLDRLRGLSGVEAVGIVENVPLDEGVRGAGFETEDAPSDDPGSGPQGGITFAGGDYFEAMGLDVLRGRAFVDDDVGSPGNVVLSRAAADLLWPTGDPLGRRLRSTAIREWHTVVGVVEDVLQYDLRGEPEPIVYYPLAGPTPTAWSLPSPGYVVRTSRAETIASEIRGLVREVAPEAPMYRVHTMSELVERSMVQLSFTMLTLAVAAALALVLGAIGLYGVLSYAVAQRTQEIGVRMALGAEAGRVRRMVVVQGARVVGLGIVVGLGLTLLSSRALGTLLFGVGPTDPWTLAGVALAMVAVGLLATYVPARRASRVDPVLSMRG